MSKIRNFAKLQDGFVVDGNKSRIDSDQVFELFHKMVIKRDNASYAGGADSEIFSIDINTAEPSIINRAVNTFRHNLVFPSIQKDSDRHIAYNTDRTYTIRTGQHFDSDFANMVVDTLTGHGRTAYDETSASHSEILTRLQNELAILRMHDVNGDKGPVTGQYFRWNGDQWEAQDPDPEGNFTVDFQSAVVPAAAVTGGGDTTIGFSKEISNANAIVFLNGVGPLIDSETYGDSPTNTQDSDSDIVVNAEYKILTNVTNTDVDFVVSGPSDAIVFYDGLTTNDEITVISPIDETVAHFYKSVYFADTDRVKLKPAQRYHDAAAYDSDGAGNPYWINVDSDGGFAALKRQRTHQVICVIDSDTYTDSEMRLARVGGDPLIFVNGVNLSKGQGDFYYYDSEFAKAKGLGATRSIAFDSDNYLRDSDQVVALWIRNVGPIQTDNFETLYDQFTVNNAAHPGATTGIVNISRIIGRSNDPTHTLVFLNGQLQSNTPVLTYQIRDNDIVFPVPLSVDDHVALYSFSGPTVGTSTIGRLSNVDQRVDSTSFTKVGEALIFDGSRWTHQYASTVAETPVTAAWMRVTFDSDTGPTPNKIIDRATFGFDSDQLKYSRHSEGLYYFLLDSEVVPISETNGFYMSMAVSTCAPQGQPIFASIDAQGDGGYAPGPGADSDTGLTIDVFGGQPLINNPNNRAIRVRTWDQNGNTIDPIQINVQVWFKREVG